MTNRVNFNTMRKIITFIVFLMAILSKAQDISLFPQSFITPPVASQDGSANLNYPIVLPEGLNGVTPSLSLNYNSDAGNSWMGIGWNIGVPAVYLDTRWGVPRFDSNLETELYSLFGEQLMYPGEFLPHRHKINENGTYTTEGQARNVTSSNNPIKVFHPRRKETYAKIERIGYSPSEYYWKVTNMDGSISWFGGDETGLDPLYVTKSGSNNAFWALKKRVDTHGYFIKYEYDLKTYTNAIQDGNLYGGQHLYLKKISYTGLQKLNGTTIQILKQPMYEVVFDLDIVPTRKDISFSARYGYKDVVKHKLTQISVSELFNGSNQIRKYVFTYLSGEFEKTTLKEIDEYKDNTLVFSHKMDYHNLPRNLFVEQDIQAPEISTNMLLGMDDILKISRIGTTENSGAGGELNLSVGAGLAWQTMAPTGTFANFPLYDLKETFTSGKATLIDINGDGLLDILYKNSEGKLRFYENTCANCKESFKLIYNPGIGVTYNSTHKELNGVNHFLKGEGSQRSGLINGEGGFSMEFLSAKFGTRDYKTKSMVSHYLTDANGDGLPDFVVKDGSSSLVYFNHLENGIPTFTTNSDVTPNMLIVADTITPEGDADSDYNQDEPEMGYDAVKVYSYDRRHGLKGFTVNVSLDNPDDLEIGEEVKVSIEAFDENYLIAPGHRQIFSGKLSKNNHTLTFITNSNYFDIGKNKYQYFYRTHHNMDKNPKVNWDVEYLYTDNGNLDGNSFHPPEISKLEDNFFLSNNGGYPMKFTGGGTISWNSLTLPNPLADNLRIRAIKKTYNQYGEVTNEQIIYNSPVINYGSTLIPSGSINFSTVFNYNQQTGEMSYDELEFKLIAVTNLKWHEINLTPKVNYSGITNMGGTTQPVSGEKYIIPQHSIYHRTYDNQGEYLDNPYHRTLYLQNSSQTPGYFAIELFNVYNGLNIGNDLNGAIYLTIKNDGQRVAQIKITITNGIISFPEYNILVTGSYYLTLSTNDEIDNNTPGLLQRFINYHVVNNYEILRPYNGLAPIINFITETGTTYKGPNYIGGGQFFYNPGLARSTTPVDSEGDKLIDVNALNISSMAQAIYDILGIGSPEDYGSEEEYQQAILDALGLEEGEEIGIEDIDDYLEGNSTLQDLMDYLLTSQSILPATPFRKMEGNTIIDKWIGFHEDMYVDKTSARAGKFDVLNGPWGDVGIGDPEPEEYPTQQADLYTGMSAISLYGTGKYNAKRKFDYSESKGWNKYSTKFIDLNGDRYPEIIHNNNIYYTTMTGGQKHAVTSIMGENPLEYVNSEVKGKTLKRAFNSSDLSNLSSTYSNFKEVAGLNNQNNSSVRTGLSLDDLSGDIKQEEIWMDINGDGFSDRIIKTGEASYKIHYSLGNSIDITSVNVHAEYVAPNYSPAGSTSANIGGGFGGSIGGGFSGMVDITLGGSFSQTNIKSQFIDINNDGLLDLVYQADSNLYVKYNLGNAFASRPGFLGNASNPHFSLNESMKDSSASASITVGIVYPYNFVIPIGFITIPLYVKGGGWLMVNGNVTASEVSKTFKDINGDGFPDILIDRETGFKAYNSNMGAVGKLKAINNSLGNGFELNYVPLGNTYDMPMSKWVLNNVANLKLGEQNESIAINDFYEYKNGYYDRREREFYGFELVKSYKSSKTLQQAQTMGETPFRATIEGAVINKFYNKSYYLKGKPKEQYIIKNDYSIGANLNSIPSNRLYSKTQNFYVLKPSAQDGLINITASSYNEDYDVGGKEGRGTAAVLLQKTEVKLFEYGNTPMTTTTEYNFDPYKRLRSQKNVEENLEKEFYYPDQLLSDASLSFMQDLTNSLRINTVVKTVSRENGVALFSNQSDFGNNVNTNNQLRAVEQLSVKGSEIGTEMETVVTIDKYDDAGHIIQKSTPDGKTTSIIWGYNDRYPVVTIEGLAYDQLPSAIVAQIRNISSTTPNDEAALLTQINNLRTHSSVSGKGLVTAYTYYPNTGVRTIVASNGLKTQHTYYPNGKLKEVIDNNGKIVQEFRYNFYDTDLNN